MLECDITGISDVSYVPIRNHAISSLQAIRQDSNHNYVHNLSR